MKKIETQGIYYLEPLEGSGEWYWGMDYTSGDLYEAEELFNDGHPVSQNRLLFIHYPDGEVFQPVIAEKGQYLGRPISYQGKIMILMADFPLGKIQIMEYDHALEQISVLAEIPRSAVEDCYNLMLKRSPLMLARQGRGDKLQILWPERAVFEMAGNEAFLFREGERLYFSAWYDEPEYHEEIVVRHMDTKEIVDRYPGSMMDMPDGQRWVLR